MVFMVAIHRMAVCWWEGNEMRRPTGGMRRHSCKGRVAGGAYDLGANLTEMPVANLLWRANSDRLTLREGLEKGVGWDGGEVRK